jgi:hypothetical protein
MAMQQFSLAYTLTVTTTETRHVKMITEKMNDDVSKNLQFCTNKRNIKTYGSHSRDHYQVRTYFSLTHKGQKKEEY